MSRIGRLPITIPAGVDVTIDGDRVSVKGPKGQLEHSLPTPITVTLEEGQVTVNGEVTKQRGATLTLGDVICVSDTCARVVEDDDDYFDEATADDDFDPEKWRNL